jgi:hypothetical protein
VLRVSERGIVLRVVWKDTLWFAWEHVLGIEIEGPDTVQRRFTATRLAFLGPFALAVPKRQKVAFVVIATQDGDTFFRIDGITHMQLRAQLSPWTDRYATSLRPGAVANAGQGSDVAAQLGQLADLKAQGALSEKEFAAAKARVLGSGSS